MTALETVNEFIAATCKKDIDAAIALLADDCLYENVGMSSVTGPAAVKEFLDPFLATAGDIDWVVHREAENGSTVFNERTDRFLINDRWIEIPVCGVWEVVDGRITLWRDYFDLPGFQQQMEG